MRNRAKQQMRIPIQRHPRQPLWDDDWLDDEVEPVNNTPTLRFSPTAWAKLLYFRDKSDNEVGGFGITAADDLLFVTDFVTVRQEVSCVSVKFDDEAVSKFFDQQVDLGRKPEQFARIWLHTHPADCPQPSATDENTFKRVFGGCQWAVMAIVAQDGSTYVRLSFNVGPGSQILIATEVDYLQAFGPSDHAAWDCQYEADVTAVSWPNQPAMPQTQQEPATTAPIGATSPASPVDLLDELERLDPVERQLILDELAERPDLWSGQEVLAI